MHGREIDIVNRVAAVLSVQGLGWLEICSVVAVVLFVALFALIVLAVRRQRHLRRWIYHSTFAGLLRGNVLHDDYAGRSDWHWGNGGGSFGGGSFGGGASG